MTTTSFPGRLFVATAWWTFKSGERTWNEAREWKITACPLQQDTEWDFFFVILLILCCCQKGKAECGKERTGPVPGSVLLWYFFSSFLFIDTDTEAKLEEGGPSKSHWGNLGCFAFFLPSSSTRWYQCPPPLRGPGILPWISQEAARVCLLLIGWSLATRNVKQFGARSIDFWLGRVRGHCLTAVNNWADWSKAVDWMVRRMCLPWVSSRRHSTGCSCPVVQLPAGPRPHGPVRWDLLRPEARF